MSDADEQEIERMEERISMLEHELRRASYYFGWLADYHLNAEYSKVEARKLMNDMWRAQTGDKPDNELQKRLGNFPAPTTLKDSP